MSPPITPRGAKAVSLHFTPKDLVVHLEDGRSLAVPLSWFPRLHHGTPAEREDYKIEGAGLYLHWPDLDEDLEIEHLIRGYQSGESEASFQRWLTERTHR